MDIVKLMLHKGANDWSSGLVAASVGGYIDIVKLMIIEGKKSWTWHYIKIFLNNTLDTVIRMCITKEIPIRFDIIKLLIETGSDIVHKLISYPNNANILIGLLDIGLDIKYLYGVTNIQKLISNISTFKSYTKPLLNEYMPSVLSIIVIDYCGNDVFDEPESWSSNCVIC